MVVRWGLSVHYSDSETTEVKRVANNFYDWLIDLDYRDKDDKKEDIADVLEDLTKVKEVAPKLFNLIKEISDR